ncbi:hypothetical protein L1887_16473 [Cichorium endivia]|nr:hypothetical protein L1887_16473 [Cichorium endivia]
MEEHPKIVLFSFALLILLQKSCAVDTVYANEPIKDGNTIISAGEMFELGFFSPGSSKNRYLGIWYKKISTVTVVWVANRETPLTDNSGEFKVRSSGGPAIYSGGNTMIWSSNYTVANTNLDPVAQLLDTGNLVIWDKNQNMIWQSFDYPGDTLLPGMKFGKDLVTGIDRYLTSWRTPSDPFPGHYVYSVFTYGYPQIFERKGSDLHFRIGPWNGVKFHGLPMDQPNPLYSSEFVVNQKEIYYKYELKSSVAQRILLMSDGNIVQLHWIERMHDWIQYGNAKIDACGVYGLCGPYGSCSINRYPPCRCMDGFVPTLQEEWSHADWSSGCKLKKPLSCASGDGFKRLKGLKFPDTQWSWYNESMTIGECETACKIDCNCTAYANLDIRNGGSGCLLWFGDLIDIRDYDEDQYIYIRMAASELTNGALYSRRTIVAITIVVVSLAALLLFVAAYVYRNRKKMLHMKGEGNRIHALDKKNSTSEGMEDLDEVPFYSLYEIAKATNNFSNDNKIGEGGFGPVYKGVLEDGKEVAVKRLSERSEQGLDEFKNEVICIAKLQHRNLVKLLGYCIHGNELILIYEYMANKSLDSFIFDYTKSLMLDWPQRFRIIHGMARGILYLHQDSRLQIIHRDLKAANILLDNEMHPKISDFGLARKFVGFDNAAKTKKVVGTYGYISPEYASRGRFSVKSDVFSFGVLVLEIVSGKRNREFSYGDHRDNLLGHVWRLYKEDKSIEVLNASLRERPFMGKLSSKHQYTNSLHRGWYKIIQEGRECGY